MNDVIVTPPKPSGVKRRKARDTIHRLTLLLAVVTPLFFIVAALGAKFGIWSWQFGLGTLTRGVGMKLLMGCLGFGVLAIIATAIVTPRKGWWVGALALIVGLAGMAKGAATQKKVAAIPFIHDVTTDTQNPPTFTEVILAERAKVKGVNTLDYIGKKDKREGKLVSALQSKAYPAVRPLVLEDSPEVVFGEALMIAKSMGWDIKAQDAATGKIEATATTFWYGFEDDVVIRIRPSEGGGAIVDARSVSRVGGSDLGANADRVKAFLAKLGG
jgi:uncharacterized protein (DUF1499 family)